VCERIPSGLGENGLDERLQYLRDEPEVARAIFADPDPLATSYALFDRLWGKGAPERFRTIFGRPGKVVCDVRSVGDPGDPTTVILEFHKGRRDTLHLLVKLVHLFDRIVTDVADVHPDLRAEVKAYRRAIGGELSFADIFERNDNYEALRRSPALAGKVKLAGTLKKEFLGMLMATGCK
jgi:hypothetical protein